MLKHTAIAVLVALAFAACERVGPGIDVETRATATVEPLYRNMVVLFRFFRDGKQVHETTDPVSVSPSRADHRTTLGPGATLGVTAAVYWNNGEEFVAVSEAQSRQLDYSQARELAEASGEGAAPRTAWAVDLHFDLDD